jgi:hypothetical protein
LVNLLLQNVPSTNDLDLTHPLLGEKPTLKLMKDRDEVAGFNSTQVCDVIPQVCVM